jgi:hypothetical protein
MVGKELEMRNGTRGLVGNEWRMSRCGRLVVRLILCGTTPRNNES